ncbi:hypothetical protein EVJ58_g3794 [Rhodofomes roseus]|uniref:Uncharacterized protein n=1 Tax=Rhodofomes roseus TaxID=34475 RepID=A0A4Y9YK97_9APHY|nr:hypothetical protein EVJ58_g3794 [Rhodofomes roseus]
MQTRVRKMSEARRTPARSQTSSAGDEVKRPDSPDLDTILANTPRPRRRTSVAISSSSVRSPTNSVASPFGWRASGPDQDVTESDDDLRGLEGDDGSESDSSIDLHTPLPHLMFRDGLLSPRSKLLPQVPGSPFPYSIEEDEESSALDRSKSVLSVVSTAGSVMTKSGLLFKDPRDTVRRRRRHRDGQLLRAGMGLTTGLGWSDSEDEDAPSTLTRRLIHTSIARRPSSSLSRPSSEFTQDATSPAPYYEFGVNALYAELSQRGCSSPTATQVYRGQGRALPYTHRVDKHVRRGQSQVRVCRRSYRPRAAFPHDVYHV